MYEYKSYVPHGITFGDKHTWKDWKIVPTSRPVFNPPDPKYVMIDIPGSDETVDMTESLTGFVHYNRRKGSFEFQVENRNPWQSVYEEIINFIHGQKMRAILDDDPAYFYEGRFKVNEWQSNEFKSLIVIDYDVDPYKYELASSVEPWLWDPFNFNTGIIREYADLQVDGELDLTIIGYRKPVVPKLIVTVPSGRTLTVTFNGATFTLASGSSRILNIVITDGENELHFEGYGTVSVDYRGGLL